MKTICILLCALLTACASEMIQEGFTLTDDGETVSRLLYPYESSVQCRGCHSDQHQQYEDSMHAKAFSNPLFNAQYFKEVVPRAQRNPLLVPEARRCIACHAPVVFMNYTGFVATPAQADLFETGVTCDFCHTLAGYAENGDYQQDASRKKQGPSQPSGASTFHSEYSGFVQISEFCGNCHGSSSHFTPEVKSTSTFGEWQESPYGKRRFSCQECHMNEDGFLRSGKARFARGPAAYLNIGTVATKQRVHDKLYNHSFPGAHSTRQLKDALLLEFMSDSLIADANGRFPIALLVNNERTGHKTPSGSSGLRLMWLVVTATAADGAKIPVLPHTPSPGNVADYSIAGRVPDDDIILEYDVPSGSRLYRTVQVTAAGRQSLEMYDAVENVFDNRLGAAETRKEMYYLELPVGFTGNVTLEANLYYRGAPRSFTRRMQVPDFSAVLVASVKKQISVDAPSTTNKR